MTNVDELVDACKVLSEYCNYSTNCRACLFNSACTKWANNDLDDISHLANAFASALSAYKHKDRLLNAYRELDEVCATFNRCDECLFFQFSECPKDAIEMVLNDIDVEM